MTLGAGIFCSVAVVAISTVGYYGGFWAGFGTLVASIFIKELFDS